MSECMICFDSIGQHNTTNNILQKQYIKCKNKSCVTIICIDCMRQYIDYSRVDNQIPKCPNATCGRYYLLSDLTRFPDLKLSYAKCCFNELIGKYGDGARKNAEIQNNIETLKRLRQTFINERFPEAVAYTAVVIMPHKLRKLDKQIIEKIQDQTIKTNRICMNLICNGSLNENLICLSCDTAFCTNCEKRKDNNHVCNQSDIETIQAIKNIIKCPNCHIPIIRSDGCNNMTCASCGQYFLYNTGEAGGAGGDVTQIQTPKTKELLSVIYEQILTKLNLMTYILEIETLEPKLTNTKTFTNILVNYYKNDKHITLELELQLANAFENYLSQIHTNKRYHQAISEIELKITNKTITHEYLYQIRNILCQPI